MTNFASDNVTGVAPEIMDAILRANDEHAAMSYGADNWTDRLNEKASAIFEKDVSVFPVISGTAANVLPISFLTPPYGAIYCHETAHINTDECNASEFYTGGAKLIPLSGVHGKFTADSLSAGIFGKGVPRHSQPALVSITQTTEAGTLYSLNEISEITAVAHNHGLKVHMDGARFANSVAGLGVSPAEMTWKSGVDVLSFGATKNGAMGAELVVFFNKVDTRELEHRRVRGGHFLSKMRFVSAQLSAYLDNDLWLRNANHANAMATRIAENLQKNPSISFVHPVEANILFIRMPRGLVCDLKAAGFEFYEMSTDDPTLVRLVLSFNSRIEDVDNFTKIAQKYS
ncbi:threonine aldolase family protein [Kiloniella antarctica]|uniref:L-threonine aldolase n=1 Tax=Kiloniella antarctica TaxID=1550907 RepID=A0ABW5BHM1_9PROT